MRTKFYLAALAALMSVIGHAQCLTAVNASQTSNQVCSGSDISFFGYGTTACSWPYTIHYNWAASYVDAEGVQFMDTLGVHSGTATGLTTIPSFTVSPSSVAGSPSELVLVCLTLEMLDNTGTPVSTAQSCIDTFNLANPISPNAIISGSSCGQQNCVYVETTGGTAPYVYLLSNGGTMSGNAYACFDQAGLYYVTVVDANGCEGTDSFEITIDSTFNNSCETAQPLENNVVYNDTICNLQFTPPSCSSISYFQSAWYSINSGEFNTLNIGFTAGYYATPVGTNSNAAIEVYQSTNGIDCNGATLIHCETATGCANLADNIAVQPNTLYFIRAMAQWTSAVPATIVASLSDGGNNGICGCTDYNSCNYDPGSLINDGSCGWNGCTDPSACNYLSYASCDDGSCIFGNDLTGLVFHDVNGNGIHDVNPVAEPGLGGVGILYVEELGTTIYTNSQGQFSLPSLEAGSYHIVFLDTTGTWAHFPSDTLTVTLPTCNGLMIPLLPASGAAVSVCGYTGSWNQTMHCINGLNPGVWINNTGSVPFTGTVTVQFNPLLVPSAYSNAVPFSSYSNGVVTWNITNQNVGSYLNYLVHLAGPGTAYVGTTFNFVYTVELFDNAGNSFYTNTWTSHAIVSCAYDPNDKQAEPIGYTDNHFILSTDEIEYVIRFQNTGNAAAFNVMIEDQIDASRMDMATFQPVTASHSFSTVTENNGRVRFFFNNIMLPDSGTNEVASHGYVVYKIKPFADVQAGSVIENTALIFFDDNPAVVTNTTYHTIYDCNQLAVALDPPSACVGQAVTISPEVSYAETYAWSVNGEVFSTEPTMTFVPTEAGMYTVDLTLSNPLCEFTTSVTINGIAVPVLTLSEFEGSLYVSDGVAWQWYLNGEIVQGATTQFYSPTTSGEYSVMTTFASGCSSLSDSMVVGVEEVRMSALKFYPNPANEVLNIALDTQSVGSEISLVNGLGQVIYKNVVTSSKMVLPVADYAKGIYQLILRSSQNVVVRTIELN